MTHFYDLAARRRSMRQFTEESLSQDELAALMGTVLMAPSSKGTCCWQFIVIDDKALLQQLAQCKEHGAAMLAEDSGLGACWVQIRNRQAADGTSAEDVVRRILNVPEHLRVLSLVALGHKGMERKPFNPERLKWDKVYLNVYPSATEE